MNGVVSEGISLFTNDASTLSETPRAAGGQIIPTQYVEGRFSGVDVSVLVGGVFSMALDWSNGLEIYVTSAEDYAELLGVDMFALDVLASDDDALLNNDKANGYDFVTFNIALDGSSSMRTYNDNSSATIDRRWFSIALAGGAQALVFAYFLLWTL